MLEINLNKSNKKIVTEFFDSTLRELRQHFKLIKKLKNHQILEYQGYIYSKIKPDIIAVKR
jgi:mRNA-degrading endonuclease YafQ of YafQ-DinJ toxin-antitoxin module